ncbi:MAG: TIGR02453 family protein [Gammaproteobacteria bacterium]|nr:TIGR02453 family protein [Gammaproteobacteria bacterium]
MAKPLFTPSTFTFLEQLAANNEKSWFETNKERYEANVRTPALLFIEAMGEPLKRISDEFPAIAKKTGGSLMRVHKDTRFAKDKRPYKTNIGIQFRHTAGKDVHAPGFYVHLEPDEVFLGVGLWRPPAPALNAIRASIDENPNAWLQARDAKAFAGHFELSGEALKRPPRGYSADHLLIEDLKRKDFIAIAKLTPADAIAPGFAGKVGEAFADAAPFMRFLCTALDVRF